MQTYANETELQKVNRKIMEFVWFYSWRPVTTLPVNSTVVTVHLQRGRVLTTPCGGTDLGLPLECALPVSTATLLLKIYSRKQAERTQRVPNSIVSKQGNHKLPQCPSKGMW